jgi:hypothetical protein
MLKQKNIFIIFSLVVLAFVFSFGNVYAQTPEFNNHPNDHKTLRLKNRTTGTPAWTTPISASPGDSVSFDVYYHNNVVGSTATNTRIRLDYPCSANSTIIPTAYIMANNAATVSDNARINVSGTPQKLVISSTAKWYPNQTTVPTNISVTQVGPCSVEVNIGSIQGCWEYQGHVVFDGTLTADDPDPSGNLSCYTSSEDSITLSYNTYDADNASIFRGSSRLTILGSGSRSGTYRDTGLSSDTSYTYYLRNGTSSSSTQLARVTCSTDYEEEPDADLSCYTSSEDSITLSYNTYDANNASIFRGNSRLTILGSGSRSGTYRDTGLSSDTSYTYYLRNGTSSSSTQLARVTCSTDYEDEGRLVVSKTVKSLERTSSYVSSFDAIPGELVSYSIKVTAKDGVAKDVVVKDSFSPTRLTHAGNLRVDGIRVSGNIEQGISVGDILEGESKTVTFDVRIASRDNFVVGTTSFTNTAVVTSENDRATDTAVVHIRKDQPVGPPTVVPTGITGNNVVDYVLLPLVLTLLIFILFRKHFIALVKRLEATRREIRAEW